MEVAVAAYADARRRANVALKERDQRCALIKSSPEWLALEETARSAAVAMAAMLGEDESAEAVRVAGERESDLQEIWDRGVKFVALSATHVVRCTERSRCNITQGALKTLVSPDDFERIKAACTVKTLSFDVAESGEGKRMEVATL